MSTEKAKYANTVPAKAGDAFIGRNSTGHMVVGVLEESDVEAGTVDGLKLEQCYNAADAFNALEELRSRRQVKSRTIQGAAWCRAGIEG